MASASTFGAPRGMRDFYPEDMLLRNGVFDAWKRTALQSGFSEYDACVVESLDLLIRKAGEEIMDQIYHFKDKSGRDLALRPEMTPTLARMVAARQGSLQFPLKWFTIAQCFRYERMTRGRKREHYQWNLDIIGESSVAAEAEVIATAAGAMRALGLDARHYRVHYSSRTLLSELLSHLGIAPEHHAAAFLALDKRGKISDEEIQKLLAAEGVDAEAIPSVFRLLDVKTPEEAYRLLGKRTNALTELETFTAMLSAYGIADLAVFNIGVIRGLSYYTGIVFEAFDVESKLRAIFGGGRYGRLLASIGGDDMTGVGLGFGDVVIAELLQEHGLITPHSGEIPDCCIGFMESEQQLTAIRITSALRQQKLNIGIGLAPEKPKSFFAKAGGSGARYAIYIGPDDISNSTIRLKHLQNRTQQEISFADLMSASTTGTPHPIASAITAADPSQAAG